MPSLLEFAYDVRMMASAGQGNSDDNKLEIRQIMLWINSYRAKACFELTDFGKNIDPQLVQDLGVVPLTKVDKADTSCPKVEWGCKILKTTIPKLVDFPKGRSLTFVGLVDKQTPIQIDEADVSFYKQKTRFGKLFDRCYLIGNTLYVVTREDNVHLKYVNIRGVFENPLDVYNYAAEGCTATCFDEETDNYPLPLRMRDIIVTNILTKELNITLKTTDDELNNTRQDNAKLP